MGIYIQYIYNKNCGVSFWTCSREISGDRVALLTLQITICLSCQTQKAMHNALCDVMWQKNKYSKKIKIKYSKKNIKKICIVSHSSYHTRRITLPRYFRWNMTNIGAINITLVYDKKSYLTDFEKMNFKNWNFFFKNSKLKILQKRKKTSSYIHPRNIPTDFEKNPNIGCRGVDRQTDDAPRQYVQWT